MGLTIGFRFNYCRILSFLVIVAVLSGFAGMITPRPAVALSVPSLPVGGIAVVAGDGLTNNWDDGDGGPATSAQMTAPYGVTVDQAGSLFFIETHKYNVREVAAVTGTQYGRAVTTGNIYYVAGYPHNHGHYSGDGGLATSADGTSGAEFGAAYDVAVDGAGNLYVDDTTNFCIRKVDASGIINNVAGTPTVQGYSGDGGPATAAGLSMPNAIAVDRDGDIFIADTGAHRLREVPATSGTHYGISMTAGHIYTIAGNGATGVSGDNGPATAAALDVNYGLAVDRLGNLYIAGYDDYCIRKVDTSGIITTVAGTCRYGYAGDGGPATSARMGTVVDVAVDNAGNLYLSDQDYNCVRRVDTSGTITTVAGGGAANPKNGGPATGVALHPWGVAVDASGNLYITDTQACQVFYVQMASPSTLSTLALSGSPGLTYSGAPLTYGLGGLTLAGADQNGSPCDLADQTVAWVVYSGPATVSGSILTITGSGAVGVTATVGGVTSNVLSFTVSRAAPALSALTLSGNPSLTYGGSPLNYDLAGGGLTLAGKDQYGTAFDLAGQTVAWVVYSGPATLNSDGHTLTISGGGAVGVTASAGGVTSNVLDLVINTSGGSQTLATLTLSGSPGLSYNGVSFTYNLHSLTLAGRDQSGNPFSLAGASVAWAVYSGNAVVGDDGHTLTITGGGKIVINASIGGITSNNLSLAVITITYPTNAMTVKVYYNGAVVESKLVTAGMIDALNPDNTIYQFSYIDNANRHKFYSSLGAPLTDIISRYLSLSSADISKLVVTGSDNYQAWWPCSADQSRLSLQQVLNGPLYYYPDGTGTNSMNNGYAAFVDDANKQVVPTIIATLAMGDPLQRFTSVSQLDNVKCLRIYTGMQGIDDIENNNSVQWIKEMDLYATVNPMSATGVALDRTTDTITAGASDTLVATVAPPEATNQAVTWSSSDTTVATVDSTGLVTAVSPGSTTITVTTVDGGFTASCVVTVNPPSSGGSRAVYAVTPIADAAYQVGATAGGIPAMTVNTGVSGMKYFSVRITPVIAHEGPESVVFVHSRNGVQDSINVTRADLDTVQTAQAGFSVQPGDVVKAYIVDDLTNAADFNPVILQ